MEHHSILSIIDIDDILLRIFGAVIQFCPSAVGSVLLVNKKWNKNIRKRILWINYPLLSHIADDTEGDFVSSAILEEYMLELKLLEYDAEIKRALRAKKLANMRRRALISSRTGDVDFGDYKSQMTQELQKIKGLTPDQYERIGEHSGWLKYYIFQQRLGLSHRHMAVMLVLCSFVPDVLPSIQFDKWVGVHHLFKSRERLEDELTLGGSIGQQKMKFASLTTMIEQGLKRIDVFEDVYDAEERKTFRRLYNDSYLLASRERYSSLNVDACYHLMIYVAWITFLSEGRWIAMFLSYEGNENIAQMPLIVVKGSMKSSETEIFDLRERFKLNEVQGDARSMRADAALKGLYEFSDEEWQIPSPCYYHILSVLSGQKRDFLLRNM